MKKYLLLILLIGTGVMIVVMTKTGATLKTPATPRGILDLEFASNSSKVAIVTTAWAGDNIGAAKTNTYLDFLFLIFYSLFLFFTCKKIARLSSGWFSNTGLLFAKGALIAGLLDVLENSGMLYNLSFSNGPGIVALLTTTCSLIKWGLALTAAAYCLTGLVYIITQKKLRSLLA